VWQVHHAGEALPEDQDSEIVIASNSSTSRLMCPITRKYLQKPMKNRNCGHHYSREAIEQLIRSRKGAAGCPVAGCSAKVTSDTIEDDPDMERQIQRYLKKNPEKESSDNESEDLEEL